MKIEQAQPNPPLRTSWANLARLKWACVLPDRIGPIHMFMIDYMQM